MKTSLCITTYNKPFQLEQVIESIKRMTILPSEVIICDDGSGPETKAMLSRVSESFPVPLRHLWQPDLGWQVSKSRNMGIRVATGEYIVFIDGDCMTHRKFLEDHINLSRPGHFVLGDRAHVKEPFTSGFQPTLLRVLSAIILRRLRKRCLAIRSPFEQPSHYTVKELSASELANLAVGCNMAFWKSDVTRVNGFNESLEGWALEDIEMAARLLVSGVVARKVRRKAILYHLDHGEAVYDDATILDSTKSVLTNNVSWTPFGLKQEEAVSS